MFARLWTIGDLLADADQRIQASPNVELWRSWVGRVDAEELMSEALGRPLDDSELQNAVSTPVGRRFERMVKRREAGEPIALIRGFVEFAGLRLVVKPGVFTPRFSSELLASETIRRLRGRRQPVAVDVACGAGAVALTVATRVPAARVVGVDIAPASVRLGRLNARKLGLRNVSFAAGDLLEPLPRVNRGKVDVFAIHPPYVSRAQLRTLPPEIRDYEPVESLTDRSVDGLGLVRRLAAEAPAWLRPGGWVLVEVAPDLSRGVRTVLGRSGFVDIKSTRDAVGATRVVAGRLPA